MKTTPSPEATQALVKEARAVAKQCDSYAGAWDKMHRDIGDDFHSFTDVVTRLANALEQAQKEMGAYQIEVYTRGKQLGDHIASIQADRDAQALALVECRGALEEIQTENARAKREFTNVSNNLISNATDRIFVKPLSPSADRVRAMSQLAETASMFKFGTYPAHGSGFVLIVLNGNANKMIEQIEIYRSLSERKE